MPKSRLYESILIFARVVKYVLVLIKGVKKKKNSTVCSGEGEHSASICPHFSISLVPKSRLYESILIFARVVGLCSPKLF